MVAKLRTIIFFVCHKYCFSSTSSSNTMSNEWLISTSDAVNGGLDHRRQAPGVRLRRFVDPEHRGVGAPLANRVLNPADRGFVNQVVAAVQSIDVCEQDDFLAGLYPRAVIEQIADGNGCALGNSLMRGHDP